MCDKHVISFTVNTGILQGPDFVLGVLVKEIMLGGDKREMDFGNDVQCIFISSYLYKIYMITFYL